MLSFHCNAFRDDMCAERLPAIDGLRFVWLVLHHLLVYMDDVIVFGRSFDEELHRLDEVFSRLKSAKLKLKPSKCSIFQRSANFWDMLCPKPA